LTDARAQLPSLKAFPANPVGDTKALAYISEWCGAYTPWTAPEASGEVLKGGGAGVWLDATGCAHLFGGEAKLTCMLIARMQRLGFTARIGLAETSGAAWAVARFSCADGAEHDGSKGGVARIVPPGGVRAALTPLSVMALRLPMNVVEGLYSLGLRHVGDLLNVPRAPLTARFGDVLIWRLDQALGRVFEPISTCPKTLPMLVRTMPTEPLGQHADIAIGLKRLLRQLEARLRRKHLGARRLVLNLYHVDGEVSRASIGTSCPVRDPDHLFRLFADRLEGLDPGFGIEVMALAATVTESLSPEQIPFASRQSRSAPEELGALVDRLQNRLGAENVMRFDLRESHVPERAAAPVPVFHTGPSASLSPSTCRRPIRLLPQPETIDATAMISDGPPVMLRWRRVLYWISWAEGPERIAPEWWLKTMPRHTPWDPETRDYYRLEAAGGSRFWVFREGLYHATGEMPEDLPRWYLHGLFA
jgi:protein ImuB